MTAPARIPSAFVEEVRAHISLAAIIGRDVKLKRAGRELQGCCPFHNERTPSFHVNDAKGFYHCFGCGASGDAVDYAMQRHGLGFVDAVRMLADEAGLAIPGDDGERPRPERHRLNFNQRLSSPPVTSPSASNANKEMALNIWGESVRPDETPVQAYLASRGLCLPDNPARVLRYNPACPMGGDTMPAMVALVRDPETAEPLGIHRTWLTLSGGRACDAEGKKLAKMTLGTGRGAIMLSPDSLVESGLAIAEGIETALHGLRRWPHLPAWSALNANGIAAFPVLRGIEHISIYADNDLKADGSNPGMQAARACASRWAGAGRHWAIHCPDEAGKDFADLGQAA